MFSLFILAAMSFANKLANAKPPTPRTLTKKQAALQAPFTAEAQPYGCYTQKVADFIRAITGFQVEIKQATPSFNPLPLEIRTENGHVGIVAGVNGYAYCPARNNYVKFSKDSSIVGPAESKAFLDNLANQTAVFNVNPIGWSYVTLGIDHGNALIKAIDAENTPAN
jgi:hypothetical protein